MTLYVALLGIGLAATPTLALEEDAEPAENLINIAAPYYVDVNVPFQVELSLSPKAPRTVSLAMEKSTQVKYSQSQVLIAPGQTKTILATVQTKGSGIAWLRALSEGYGPTWNYVIVDFDGTLKATAAGPIAYDKPATISLALLDSGGKPLSVNAELEMKLQSADGFISDGNGA